MSDDVNVASHQTPRTLFLVYPQATKDDLKQQQRERMMALAHRLEQQCDVHVLCDVFLDPSDHPLNWPQWMDEQISLSDFVVVYWTKLAAEYVSQECQSGHNSVDGFRFELEGACQAAQARKKERKSPQVLILNFGGNDAIDSIPKPIRRQPLFMADSPSLDDHETLDRLAGYIDNKSQTPPSAAVISGELTDWSPPSQDVVLSTVIKFFAPRGPGRSEILVRTLNLLLLSLSHFVFPVTDSFTYISPYTYVKK